VEAQRLIREWVRAEGRKLSWLAEQVPVHAGDLSRWLNGKQMPRAVYRVRLTDITGINVKDETMWRA
jgi:hypothetical protein